MDYEKFKQKFPLYEKEEQDDEDKEVEGGEGKETKKLSKSKIELHPKLDQESY